MSNIYVLLLIGYLVIKGRYSENITIFKFCEKDNLTFSIKTTSIQKVTCYGGNKLIIDSLENDHKNDMISFDTINIKSFILERIENWNSYFSTKYLEIFNQKIFLLDDNKLIYDSLIINQFKIRFEDMIILKRDSFNSFSDYLEDLQLFNLDMTSLNVTELINEIKNLKHLSNLTIENTNLDIESVLLGTRRDNLKILNLRKNSLKLEPYHIKFNYFKNLEYLNLGNNLIDNIPDFAFNTMRNLTYLNLESNRIESINKNAFTGLVNLIELNLENNLISNLGDFALFDGLKNLQSLSIASNKIKSIDYNTFNGLFNLIELKVSFNLIENIHQESFSNLTNIKRMDFSKNKISSIDISLIDHLSHLEIFNLDNDLFKNIKFYKGNCWK